MARFQDIALGLAAVSLLTLVGCRNQPKTAEDEIAERIEQEMRATENVSRSAVFADLTPEMLTLIDRPVDIERRIAVINNSNWRLFWEDWQRATLYERPSRLSPKPIP